MKTNNKVKLVWDYNSNTDDVEKCKLVRGDEKTEKEYTNQDNSEFRVIVSFTKSGWYIVDSNGVFDGEPISVEECNDYVDDMIEGWEPSYESILGKVIIHEEGIIVYVA